MYHGTRENVTKHFANLGYRIPERMDIADALQQITLPEGARFRTSGKHLTREEFSQGYKRNFKVMEGVVQDLPKTLHYSQSPYSSALTVFRRQWILTIRNRAFAVSQIAQSLIQGLLIGTVFFKLSSTDYITRYGFCFTTMMALSLAAMAQIPQIIKERNVYYKQRSANFFRTQTYVWASVRRSVREISNIKLPLKQCYQNQLTRIAYSFAITRIVTSTRTHRYFLSFRSRSSPQLLCPFLCTS